MLALSSIPILIEMFGEMKAVVDWKITVVIFAYTLFAFSATEQFGTKLFEVNVQCCKAALSVVVAYGWLSLVFNIERSIVPCLIAEGETAQRAVVDNCVRMGLNTKCLDSIAFINRLNAATDKCATSVVGRTLGNIYNASIVLCRFIPSSVFGMWSLFTWTSERFAKETRVAEKETQPTFSVPSTKVLFLCAVLLFSCLVVEAGVASVMPLSHFTVLLPFVAVIALHRALHTMTYGETTRNILSHLQQTCIYMCLFYTLADVVMNAVTMMNACVRMEAEDNVLQQACTKTGGSFRLEDCYQHIAEMNPAFFSGSTKCPDMTKPSHAIFIMANILQVVTLTFGMLTALVRGKHVSK